MPAARSPRSPAISAMAGCDNPHKDRHTNEKRKYFFFKKKKQKTFALCDKPPVPMGKSGAALDR
jgi:hypothetical protein